MAEPSVAMFWGEQEFLLRQAAHDLLGARGVHATEMEARDWLGSETFDLATPSLWGERRGLLVHDCQALPEAGLREIRAYLEAPSPEALCVLTLTTSARSLPPLAKAVQAAGGLVRQIALKRKEMLRWVIDRGRVRGARITGAGATALIATVGDDLASLDQSLEQLASAFTGRPIGAEEVRAQFQGVAEQRVWDLCDQALSGRLPQALVALRSMLDAKEDPLLILGGIASRIRDLIKVRNLPERMPSTEAARAAGLRFDWQVRRYREQARRFAPEDLVWLHRQAAEADRVLKGGAGGDVVLPPLVAAMAGEPEAALDVVVRVSR